MAARVPGRLAADAVRRLGARRRDEHGFAMSSPLALLSVAAVALAAVAFVTTDRGDDAAQAVAPVTASPSPSASPTRTAVAAPVQRPAKPEKKPVVRRGQTYVEVYNNSGISGLAGQTASRAQGAGWQVVGSDNWYGTIAASTVYYPARLKAEARLLARDLGIDRLKPLIAPMRGDRLTVILTSDYS